MKKECQNGYAALLFDVLLKFGTRELIEIARETRKRTKLMIA